MSAVKAQPGRKAEGVLRFYYDEPRDVCFYIASWEFGVIGATCVPTRNVQVTPKDAVQETSGPDKWRKGVDGWFFEVPVTAIEEGARGNVRADLEWSLRNTRYQSGNPMEGLLKIVNPQAFTGGADAVAGTVSESLVDVIRNTPLPAVGGSCAFAVQGAVPGTKLVIRTRTQKKALKMTVGPDGKAEGNLQHDGKVYMTAYTPVGKATFKTERELDIPLNSARVLMNLEITVDMGNGKQVPLSQADRIEETYDVKREQETIMIARDTIEVPQEWDQRGFRKIREE